MLTMEPGGEGIVLVKGRLDAAQAASAQAYLDKLQGTVTLDLAGLDYISSAGLGVLLKTQKRLTGQRRKGAPDGSERTLTRHLRLLGIRSAL